MDDVEAVNRIILRRGSDRFGGHSYPDRPCGLDLFPIRAAEGDIHCLEAAGPAALLCADCARDGLGHRVQVMALDRGDHHLCPLGEGAGLRLGPDCYIRLLRQQGRRGIRSDLSAGCHPAGLHTDRRFIYGRGDFFLLHRLLCFRCLTGLRVHAPVPDFVLFGQVLIFGILR